MSKFDPNRFLSVDIEIADVCEVPEGGDLEDFAPFHISVAATVVQGRETSLWYSRNQDGTIAAHLNEYGARALLRYLDEMQEAGYSVCAWNGLSFDMRWIGYAAGDMALAHRVALRMFDPMFQFFMAKGFPVGLGKVGKGMGISQAKLMDGADAPKEWMAGNHHKVMDYVIGDCEITNKVVNAIYGERRVKWQTQKGTTSVLQLPELLPVSEVIDLPMPDQSWMSEPMSKAKFTAWMFQ